MKVVAKEDPPRGFVNLSCVLSAVLPFRNGCARGIGCWICKARMRFRRDSARGDVAFAEIRQHATSLRGRSISTLRLYITLYCVCHAHAHRLT